MVSIISKEQLFTFAKLKINLP